MKLNNSDTVRDIVMSIKVTCLAILWGGISGMIGFCGLAFMSIGPISLLGIFGGFGLLFLNKYLICLMPFVHCLYAFFIIRFRVRGILFVMILHYLSAFLMTVVWITCDYRPRLWDFITVHSAPSNPFGYLPLIIQVPPAMGLIIAYNTLLFFLLWRELKKSKSGS